jgi:hypothetical protein
LIVVWVALIVAAARPGKKRSTSCTRPSGRALVMRRSLRLVQSSTDASSGKTSLSADRPFWFQAVAFGAACFRSSRRRRRRSRTTLSAGQGISGLPMRRSAKPCSVDQSMMATKVASPPGRRHQMPPGQGGWSRRRPWPEPGRAARSGRPGDQRKHDRRYDEQDIEQRAPHRWQKGCF